MTEETEPVSERNFISGANTVRRIEMALEKNPKFVIFETNDGEHIACRGSDIQSSLNQNKVSCSGSALSLREVPRVARPFERPLTEIKSVSYVKDD